MGWHYACKKVKGDFDEDVFILVEVYPELQNGHTDGNGTGAYICGQSPKDLAMWLRQAADDVERYGAIKDE